MARYSSPSFFTSRIYPIEVIETSKNTGVPYPVPQYMGRDDMANTGLILSGTLSSGLQVYSNWPVEEMKSTGLPLTGGSLVLGLISYTNWPAEEMKSTGLPLTGGTLINGLVSYNNYPVEEMKSTGLILTGGTLI